MPVTLDARGAQRILRAHGHDAQAVTPLSGGLWSRAFAFREGDRDLVVRFHERRDDLEKDRFAVRWASPRLRTARVIEIGESEAGAYGISERVAGTLIDDLDESALRLALPALFSSLDAMREVDLTGTSGYGLWHGDGNARHATWEDALLSDLDGARARVRTTGMDTGAFDAGVEAIRALLPYASDARHVVHNDLLYRNVIVDDAGVVLIDWGASIYGDFLYDWALLAFWWPWYRERWGGIDIDAEIAGHFQGREPERMHERMRLCEVHIGIEHIAFQAARGRLDDARWTAARTVARIARS